MEVDAEKGRMESDGIQIPSHCNWPIFPRGTEPSREGRIFPVVLCLSEDKVCLASRMVCRMSQVSDLVVRRVGTQQTEVHCHGSICLWQCWTGGGQ